MITTNESAESIDAVVSRIWHEIEGEFVFDDSRVNTDIVRDKVLVERAKMLRQLYFRASSGIPSIYYQDCCFEIRCQAICGPLSKEYRATIPGLISGLADKAIKYIGSVDGATPFDYVNTITPVHSYTLTGNKNKPTSYTTINYNELRFQNLPRGMTKGRIVGIFSNPFECDCIEGDKNIFIGADMLSDLEKSVKLELQGFVLGRKIDKRNNTAPDN